MKEYEPMTNYEKKEEKALDKIAKEIIKLDTTLDKLDESDNRVKAWVEHKKAVHEIKNILHEANKYDEYKEEDWMDFIASLDD